ncbi:hypothetical protein [Rathayibacter sp. Leaf248]|uniref:hypothetical protein n=1 Tax=Rathayibacter sp. Leaf248 TaxID=2876555 RepID=UPI001E2D7F0D|nr:hypothetical protein [Rathayibacter sp. Leaf248]
MTLRTLWTRTAIAAAGCLLLTTVAGQAVAAELDDDVVDVNVTITPLTGTGALSMSVAGTSAELTETGSTAELRRFTGTLPSVTVTDTRPTDEIPEDAGWYVLGTASDFVGSAGQSPISAGQLGWSPRLIDGGDSGVVSAGSDVGTVFDDGPNDVGLVDQEFLAVTEESAAVSAEGSWTSTADLTLETLPTSEAGDYSSTLTLTLME